MSRSNRQSAGLLMFRTVADECQVFLVHPGGPYWVKKDEGAWTLPKGEFQADETPLAAALREFHEETGFTPAGPYLALGSVRQKSGKVVTAWAFRGDCNPEELVSNTCEIEWPPRSGKRRSVPEVDRGAWFTLAGAEPYLREEQRAFLDRLTEMLGREPLHRALEL